MSTSQSGYTILEMLIALAILATVLVALYAAGGTSLDLISRTGRTQRAVLLAQSKLDEISADRGALPLASHGEFDTSDFRWRITTRDVTSHLAAASPYRLQDVRLTITWPIGTHTQNLTVNTRHLGYLRP